MSERKLSILAIVAVFMVIWAVVQSRVSHKSKTEPGAPTYLIQGLDPVDIDSIIIGAGEDAVTLKKQANSFVVINKDNFPASAKQINDLITRSLDIRIGRVYTDNPENHATLGVTEQDARSVVKFLKPDSSLFVGYVIGNNREVGQGNYVRLLSSNNVYVTENVPWIRNRPIDYIEQQLISIKKEDIESVTVASPAGQYKLNAEAEGEGLVLEDMPQDKKLKESEAKSVFSALTSLSFTDVKMFPAQDEQLTFDRQYVCKLKDSTVYTLKIAKSDDKMYVTCVAEFMDQTPIVKEKKVETEQELKEKEAKLLARDKAKEFTARHQRWMYQIGDWKAKYLSKELADLLEDKPKEAEKATEKQQNDAIESTKPFAEPNTVAPGS
jgi:hypothetical protein